MITAMPKVINIRVYASVSNANLYFADKNFQIVGANIQRNCD
jgi:hypothetical protein